MIFWFILHLLEGDKKTYNSTFLETKKIGYKSNCGKYITDSQGNTRTHYQYYCNASSAGQVIMINNTGSMRQYSIESNSQSIARLQNSTANGNWYYSRVDSYYYMYITRNGGTNSGLFGQGRRTRTVTNPTTVAPYASGSSWQNI